MKPKAALLPFLALSGSLLLAIPTASAATYTWNNSNVDDRTPKADIWDSSSIPGAYCRKSTFSGTSAIRLPLKKAKWSNPSPDCPILDLPILRTEGASQPCNRNAR
jgi:hypothetical protein